MSSRFHNRRRRAVPCRDRIEELEGRTLLSITASAFSDNVLENTASKIELSPFVQDSDPSATLTFDLVSTTTTDGGQVSVNAASGLVSYTPAANSPSPGLVSVFRHRQRWRHLRTRDRHAQPLLRRRQSRRRQRSRRTVDHRSDDPEPAGSRRRTPRANRAYTFSNAPGRERRGRHGQLHKHQERGIHVHATQPDFHRRCDHLLPGHRRDGNQ